ncbi:MAG: hypothetical protein RMY62_016505, partial [Nostoc sp. ZfuVER08]|nr:hypothetical protein [Nostoc sp. ZfuVER08]
MVITRIFIIFAFPGNGSPKQQLVPFNRPALKIEAETTQNRSNIIFIVPCERSSWSKSAKVLFGLL